MIMYIYDDAFSMRLLLIYCFYKYIMHLYNIYRINIIYIKDELIIIY